MTDKERQLIIDSIIHWQKDAVEKFEELNLKTNKIKSSVGSGNCPLCQNYFFCEKCLWMKYTSGKTCCGDEQEYTLFYKNPTKENALKVIEKLWRIGKNI